MAHSILSLWLLVAWLGFYACIQEAPHQNGGIMPVPLEAPSVSFNNSQFAFSLYREVMVNNPDQNVLFSPLSLSVPLTLLALHAKPEARYQILQGLGFSPAQIPETQEHSYYGKLLNSILPQSGECRIDPGNVLFVDQKRNPVFKFVAIAQKLYHTNVFLTNLGNSKIAKNQISYAIRKQTHGKVRTLLREPKKHSILILANYIFFKGKWKHRFDPRLTEMRPFWLNEEVTIQVPMMQRAGWFQVQYFPHLYSHILQLPYSCNIMAIFILPEVGKIRECEEALAEEDFSMWTRPLALSKMRLYFPKFSLSGNILLEQLKFFPENLDLFSYQSGLSGISLKNRPMKISQAVHRTELTVNEDGAEEDISELQFLPKQLLPTLSFDKPFLLLILEENSHNLLFLGKVMNPTVKS